MTAFPLVGLKVQLDSTSCNGKLIVQRSSVWMQRLIQIRSLMIVMSVWEKNIKKSNCVRHQILSKSTSGISTVSVCRTLVLSDGSLIPNLDISCCTDVDALFNTRHVTRARLRTQQRLNSLCDSFVSPLGCVVQIICLVGRLCLNSLSVRAITVRVEPDLHVSLSARRHRHDYDLMWFGSHSTLRHCGLRSCWRQLVC